MMAPAPVGSFLRFVMPRPCHGAAANASGFAVAFLVSFGGHRLLSFRGTGTTLAQSFQRFLLTALAGFAANAAAFVLLLRVAGWPALAALLVGLVVAAAQTFLLSRFWAFRR